jgi:hypothetical protein
MHKKNNPKPATVAIDPGDSSSGIVALVDGYINFAANTSNEKVIDVVRGYQEDYRLRVVVEDIRPYSGITSMNTLETCKYIGELRYRLKTARIAFRMYPRATVKQWIFENYKKLLIPLIDAKIIEDFKKGKLRNLRKASYNYVDDSMIVYAMRHHWGIPEPSRIGERNIYGLSAHSWQALALATFYEATARKEKHVAEEA